MFGAGQHPGDSPGAASTNHDHQVLGCFIQQQLPDSVRPLRGGVARSEPQGRSIIVGAIRLFDGYLACHAVPVVVGTDQIIGARLERLEIDIGGSAWLHDDLLAAVRQETLIAHDG